MFFFICKLMFLTSMLTTMLRHQLTYLHCSQRSAESPDESVRRLDDLVKRQREFGDLLMSSDIKQVPICGMSFGSVELPKQTAPDTVNNDLVSVN